MPLTRLQFLRFWVLQVQGGIQECAILTSPPGDSTIGRQQPTLENRARCQGREIYKWPEEAGLIEWERHRETVLNGVKTIILEVKQPQFEFKGHYSTSSLPELDKPL